MTINWRGEAHVLDVGVELHLVFSDNGRIVMENKGGNELSVTTCSPATSFANGWTVPDSGAHGGVIVKIKT